MKIEGALRRFFEIMIPFLIFFIYVLILALLLSRDDFLVLSGFMLFYFIPPAGKESMIPLSVAALSDNLGIMVIPLVAVSIAMLDIVAGLFMMWNWDLIKKVPFLGPWVDKFEKTGSKKLEKKPWVRRWAFFGVALFVAFPFQGSGGIGGTIIGRIVGLNKKRVWYSIIVGSLFGCFLIATISYFATNLITEFFQNQPIYSIAFPIVVIVIILYLYISIKKKKENDKEIDKDV